jgi:hypothetical protein
MHRVSTKQTSDAAGPRDINLPLLSWGNRSPSEHTAVCQWSPEDKVRIQIQTCSSGNTVRGAIPSIPYGSNMCVDCHFQDLDQTERAAQSHTSEARLSGGCVNNCRCFAGFGCGAFARRGREPISCLRRGVRAVVPGELRERLNDRSQSVRTKLLSQLLSACRLVHLDGDL